jgi:NADPH-dependent 2,4-dienoyl-CoA reductase/sulfur reductase-like enzyme
VLDLNIHHEAAKWEPGFYNENKKYELIHRKEASSIEISSMASLLRKRSVQASLFLIAGTGSGIFAYRAASRRGRLQSLEISPLVVTENGTIKTDVLVVGSGAAALTAALRVKSLGFSPLIVEKSAKVGGTTTYSGGACWIPNTHIQAAVHGFNDSVKEALNYMEHIVGDAGPASSRERKLSFLENGPKMVSDCFRIYHYTYYY